MLNNLVAKLWDDVDDMLSRAGWTAMQTFLALVVADMANMTNPDYVKKAIIAAIAAGASALKTAVVQRRQALEDDHPGDL